MREQEIEKLLRVKGNNQQSEGSSRSGEIGSCASDRGVITAKELEYQGRIKGKNC